MLSAGGPGGSALSRLKVVRVREMALAARHGATGSGSSSKPTSVRGQMQVEQVHRAANRGERTGDLLAVVVQDQRSVHARELGTVSCEGAEAWFIICEGTRWQQRGEDGRACHVGERQWVSGDSRCHEARRIQDPRHGGSHARSQSSPQLIWLISTVCQSMPEIAKVLATVERIQSQLDVIAHTTRLIDQVSPWSSCTAHITDD